VSSLALGTLPFGGHQRPEVGDTDLNEAQRILDVCLDQGLNLVDTADKYGYGRSEEVVGEIIKGRRERIVLATKCGSAMSDDPNDIGSSRRHITKSVERSLRRLGTDYIDIYQLHQWDGKTALEETLAALDSLVTAGLIRYPGCSNFAAWQFMKALAVSDRLSYPRMVSHQIYYSAIGREAELDLIPSAVDQGVSVLVWSPLAGGLLGGRWGRQRAMSERLAKLEQHVEPPVPDVQRVLHTQDVLDDIANELGATAAQISIAYLLTKPGITSVILGPRTSVHAESALKATTVALTLEHIERINATSSPGLPYPLWHQVRSSADRFSAADAIVLQAAPPATGATAGSGQRHY
jgi:aryl-alcohol dehydrogenase-like predicted oxidoreductase